MKMFVRRIKIAIQIVYGRLMCFIYSFLPIEKKVVFSNFRGKCYADNPRYVLEKLHQMDDSIELVWLKHKGYNYEVPDYVRTVQWPSREMFKELSTAAVWVDSHHKPVYVFKRRRQFFIQCWHGGLGIKKIELDIKDKLAFNDLMQLKHSVKMADLFISNSGWISSIYRRAFDYKGEICECGYPKNDIFFADTSRVREKVYKNLNISPDTRTILYAPTFRPDRSTDWLDLDFEKLHSGLCRKTGEKWVIIARLHPTMLKESERLIKKCDYIVDASKYRDMQELMIASDRMITDYSSCIFDFMLTKKPGFIYASDYDKYMNNQGVYFDLRELFFPFAENTQQLIENIDKFDAKEYEKGLSEYLKKVELKENGTAAKAVADIIIEKIENLK